VPNFYVFNIQPYSKFQKIKSVRFRTVGVRKRTLFFIFVEKSAIFAPSFMNVIKSVALYVCTVALLLCYDHATGQELVDSVAIVAIGDTIVSPVIH